MRKILTVALVAIAAALQARTVEYEAKFVLMVPKTVDNSESLGRRTYQSQRIGGSLFVELDADGLVREVRLEGLTNYTHLVNRSRVTYECVVDQNPTFSLVGNNKTGVFRRSSVAMSFWADPSYNIGEMEEDNSLFLSIAGYGTESRVTGYVTGTMGCGCAAYGHVSPTRTMWSYLVTDVAAVFGRVQLRKRRDVP